jgi:hypothetical protein
MVFHDQILNGQPFADAMSMGATWIPPSEQIGAVLGRSLPILGVNLLLGPSWMY